MAVTKNRNPRMPAMIKGWRTAAQKSRAQIAEEFGVSKTSVSNWELGQNEPSVELLVRMAANAGGEFREFFLRASAEKSGMTGDAIKAIADSNSGRAKPSSAGKRSGFVKVPLVAVLAGAGEGRLNGAEEIEGLLSLPSDLVPNPSETKCIRVKGESMLPTIPNLAVAAVDSAQRRVEKLIGKVVAAYHETEGVVVKRMVSVEGKHRLASDNPGYMPLDLDAGWQIVGRVVWWIQTA